MPGLLDLKTDLKSLKYGNDQPGNGNSREPYIKTDINDIDNGFNRFRFSNFDDGLIRGGAIGATNASVTDALRIGKFLVDFPKGPLFIVKQVGLQLSNPRLEHKQDLPIDNTGTNLPIRGQGFFGNIGNFINNTATSAGAFIANTANRIENEIGPTRIYNLGINTLAQVPVNAFGGHIVRHGFLPTSDPSKYYASVVEFNNTHNSNRLLSLKNELGLLSQRRLKIQQRQTPIALGEIGLDPYTPALNDPITDPNLAPSDSDLIYQILPPTTNQSFGGIGIGGVIPSLSYTGGPKSVYGLGQTDIRRFSNTEDRSKIEDALNRSTQFAGKSIDEKGAATDINYPNTLGVSRFYFQTAESINANNFIDINNPTNKPANLDLTTYDKSPLNNIKNRTDNTQVNIKAYQSLIKSNENTRNSSPLNNIFYPSEVLDPKANIRNQGNYVVDNLKENITYSNSYGQKVVLKTFNNWSSVAREQRIGDFGSAQTLIKRSDGTFETINVNRADSINLTPLFSAEKYYSSDSVTIKGIEYNIRDLVKFKIQSILTDTPDRSNFMIFRALLTQLSDSADATWNDVKYAGRGNKFYIYDGSSRKIQLGFKVAALSVEEMAPMYSKLNYLMASIMPDYNGNLMRGSLHRLTVGNYLDAQLGIVNSLSYTIPNETPWEIALDEPEGGNSIMILPHIIDVSMTFTPIGVETGGNNVIESKGRDKSYIAQNNTGKDISKLQYYDSFL